jgi:hypothetical protein
MSMLRSGAGSSTTCAQIILSWLKRIRIPRLGRRMPCLVNSLAKLDYKSQMELKPSMSFSLVVGTSMEASWTPKIKIVLWITIPNKLLTWDNLIKRGWNGPS